MMFSALLQQSASVILARTFPAMERRDIPVAAYRSVSFLLVNDHAGSLLVLPDVLDQEVQATREDESSVFENLCRDSIGSTAIIVLQPFSSE